MDGNCIKSNLYKYCFKTTWDLQTGNPTINDWAIFKMCALFKPNVYALCFNRVVRSVETKRFAFVETSRAIYSLVQ